MFADKQCMSAALWWQAVGKEVWNIDLAVEETAVPCAANPLHRPQGSDKNGQIIEFTDSRAMCYHLHLKANPDSVPCSATNSKSQNPVSMSVLARVIH